MKCRGVGAGILTLCAGLACGFATVAQEVSGPAELPPSGFDGMEFVDSRGCAFVRASLGGRETWVPRVARDRSAVCGRAPTFASEPAKAPGPVAEPAVAAAEPATASERAPEPRAVPASVPSQPSAAAMPRGSGVFSSARATRLPKPPAGYKYAFDEGRYNPDRGERRSEGRVEMARVWTLDVPQGLTEAAARAERAAGKPASAARLYVEVGAFADPTTAERAARQIDRLGYPVGMARRKGSDTPVRRIMAGPFDSPAERRTALDRLRRSGFPDAQILQ